MNRLLLLFCAMILPGVAAAQTPANVKSAAFLEVIATRGAACSLLKPWQASALRALVLQDMERWPREERALLPPEARARLATTTCEDEAVRAWIDAAQRGFESEMLAPYLVAYRHFARAETRPDVFTKTATRLRYAEAIDAISAKLDALAASGAVPDGGGPWPEFTSRIEDAMDDYMKTLASGEAPAGEQAKAAAFIAQAAHVVELWLMEP